MDLLDIVYHLSSLQLNSVDHNKIIDLIHKSGKEYLFHQSFLDVRDKIFKQLENSIKENIKEEH